MEATKPSTERPSAIRVLVEARELLAERGWVAESPHEGDWFGEQEGPLTMRAALWAVARWEKGGQTLVDPGAAGRAVKALCTVLYRRRDDPGSYVALGRWGREPGRTQKEVLALFDRTIEALRRGAREFAAKLEAALAEEGDGSSRSQEPERCPRWPECDGTCECQRTGWIPPQQ